VFPGKAQIAVVALLAALGGCRASPPGSAGAGALSDAGYATPPAVTLATPAAGGVVLSGEAPPGAEVRLAPPAGEPLAVRADADGRWRLEVPRAQETRIFGVSADSAGRRVQAQGYLLVGPRGQTAVLRAGTGAIRLDRPAGSRIAAIDFDADGGALVSGWAAAGTDVAIRLDGRSAGEARADAEGRFSFAIPRLSGGAHRIEATGVAFIDEVALDSSPAAPLADWPLRSQLTRQGLRADWLTPGGGVQSTLLAG